MPLLPLPLFVQIKEIYKPILGQRDVDCLQRLVGGWLGMGGAQMLNEADLVQFGLLQLMACACLEIVHWAFFRELMTVCVGWTGGGGGGGALLVI